MKTKVILLAVLVVSVLGLAGCFDAPGYYGGYGYPSYGYSYPAYGYNYPAFGYGYGGWHRPYFHDGDHDDWNHRGHWDHDRWGGIGGHPYAFGGEGVRGGGVGIAHAGGFHGGLGGGHFGGFNGGHVGGGRGGGHR